MSEDLIFSFFRNAQTSEYRRLVLVTAIAELSTLHDPVSMSKLINRLCTRHAFTADACEDAIAALRSATGFNAVTVWNGNNAKLMRLKTNRPMLNAWLNNNATLYSEVTKMINAVAA